MDLVPHSGRALAYTAEGFGNTDGCTDGSGAGDLERPAHSMSCAVDCGGAGIDGLRLGPNELSRWGLLLVGYLLRELDRGGVLGIRAL